MNERERAGREGRKERKEGGREGRQATGRQIKPCPSSQLKGRIEGE